MIFTTKVLGLGSCSCVILQDTICLFFEQIFIFFYGSLRLVSPMILNQSPDNNQFEDSQVPQKNSNISVSLYCPDKQRPPGDPFENITLYF